MTDIKKQEEKRLHLTKNEIEDKEVMLLQEKSKLENLEVQIITQEDSITDEINIKQLEIQIAQLKSQSKMLPYLEKQLEEKRPIQMAKSNLKSLKRQLEITISNVKVLTRQINTKMA